MIEFLLRVWGLVRPYRVRFYLGMLTGVISGLIEPLMIATVAFVYGLVFPSANAAPVATRLQWAPAAVVDWAQAAQQTLTTGVQAHRWSVVVLVALIPAVLLLRGVFTYLNVYLLQWAAIRAIADLRIRLFDHLMSLSPAFFGRSKTGELMSRVTGDTGSLQNIISSATSVMVKAPATLLAMLGFLFWKQPQLTLLSLVVMPVCVVPIVIYGRKVRHSSRALQTHSAEVGNVMAEAFTGNRVIKAYNLQGVVTAQFRSVIGRFVGHYMRIVKSTEVPGPLLEFAGSLGLALLLLYLAFGGRTHNASEDFLAVILAIFTMYKPLKDLTRLHNNLEQARAASERVFQLLAVPNDIREPAHPKALQAAGAPIHFDHVSFAYADKAVLQDIELTVPPGKMLALVGGSGAGKTTLTNLLLRFYDPTAGAVRIGGTDLREVATGDLRNQIAVVSQEVVLFNDTIHNNIAFGRPGASQAEIVAAAKHAQAHEFILEKAHGYDEVIGERGTALSGGQRQRLAIARAVLRDAPILILDEATSALDTESERAVQAALDTLMQGRTTICIAHRLSTIHHADLIVVMDEGRIVETGRHEELIQRGGVYQKLYALQFRD
jgi:subfamily B ATP-binding cassette protein MsbA